MSADGTALLSFPDFVTATKPHKITPTTDILSDTIPNYYLIGDMIADRDNAEIVQSGQKIIDIVRLTKHNAAGFYKPNANLQPQGMNVLSTLAANWRFHQGNYGWTEEELLLNGGGSQDNWARLVTAWRDACSQDIWDSMEAALFATPSSDDMESASGEVPFSIPTFVTSDGLAPSGFSTVMGIDPSLNTYWRNQTKTYTAASYSTTIYLAMDTMFYKLNWKAPKAPAEWFKGTEYKKFRILTDLTGITKWAGQNRDKNNRMEPQNDPGAFANRGDLGTQYYANIPIERVNAIDDLAYTNPPYFWLDLRYLFPVFHSESFMDEQDPIRGGINQPRGWAVYTFSAYNLFCRSRRRQGLITGV